MTHKIPDETVHAFARTIYNEARNYGFDQVDIVRLINALLDSSTDDVSAPAAAADAPFSLQAVSGFHVDGFPLRSDRLRIRRAAPEDDARLLEQWMQDEYGRHFLLSCATAQTMQVVALLENPRNEIGIILIDDDRPIGAVAFLDLDNEQRRAELRKVIGESSARGQGFAEEATTLWIKYGCENLGLEKFYVSTLQTHIRNIRLNESIGFHVEGILRDDVCISGERYDVLRMGLTAGEFRSLTST